MERKENEGIFFVKLADTKDLAAIFALDRDCTLSHFKECYARGFPDLEVTDAMLEAELDEAQRKWPTFVAEQTIAKIHAAHDSSGLITGFIVTHVLPPACSVVFIDVLEVAEAVRHQGIGRTLVQAACTSFPSARTAVVYALQKGNDAALRFYEALGFCNRGKASADHVNCYGIAYDRMYFCMERDLTNA
jgi:ribosomal protein S18 acetylase RimI-like enzyme